MVLLIGADACRRIVRIRQPSMPSLIRLLVVVGTIFAVGYGIVFALATFVAPKPREITVTVPPDRFVKQQR
jgi:hypothetical protein